MGGWVKRPDYKRATVSNSSARFQRAIRKDANAQGNAFFGRSLLGAVFPNGLGEYRIVKNIDLLLPFGFSSEQ